MSEQEKKPRRISLLNTETKPKFLCLPYIKQRFFFFELEKKSFLRKMGSGGLNKKWKEGFLTDLATAINVI